MPRPQILDVPMPAGGVSKRPSTFIRKDQSPDSANVRFHQGQVLQREGLAQFGDTSGTDMPFDNSGSGEDVFGLAAATDLDGAVTPFAITDAKIYYYDSSSDKWFDCYCGSISTGVTVSAIDGTDDEITLTAAGHGRSNGDIVVLGNFPDGYKGSRLEGHAFEVEGVAGNDFDLKDASYNEINSGSEYNTVPTSPDERGKVFPVIADDATDFTGLAIRHSTCCHIGHAQGSGKQSFGSGYYFVLCNGVDDIYVLRLDPYTLTGSLGKPFIRLLGAGDYRDAGYQHVSLFADEFYSSLMLFSTDETDGGSYPDQANRFRWCKTAEIDMWAVATSTAGFEDVFSPPGEFIFRGDIGNYKGFAKKDCLGHISYIGGTDLFRHDVMVHGIGAVAFGGVAIFGGVWYILTRDNIRIWTGGGQEPIAIADDISDYIRDTINWSYIKTMRNVVDLEYGRIFFFVPTGSATLPDASIMYDTRNKNFHIDALDKKVCAAVQYDDDGDIVTLVGDDAGIVYRMSLASTNDDAAAIDQYFQTMDFVPAGREYQDRWIHYLAVSFEALGNSSANVVVSYSTDEGSNWTTIGTQTLTTGWARYKLDFSVNCRKIRLRFRNNTSAKYFNLRWIGLHAVPRGRTT